MRRLLSRRGIRYICRLLTENSKRGFFYVSDENSASENFEMEKKSINNKKKKKKKPKKPPTCVCVFDESVVGTSNTQGGKGSHTGVSCML